MINQSSTTNKDIIVPYLCKFQLFIQELQAQLYFPSSYQVSWRTKDNDQLAATTGFVSKNNLNLAKFDETLQAQTIMLYNPHTKSFIDKDTFIVVNYFLNSRSNQIKELGKITLKMTWFMKDIDNQTTRLENGKGFYSNGNNANNGGTWQKQNSPQKKKLIQQMKCLRLEEGQYLAKMKFKCQLVQYSVSKLSLSSISADEFNQPIGSFVDSPHKKGDDCNELKTIAFLDKKQDISKDQLKGVYKKLQSANSPTLTLESNSGFSSSQQQQLKQSNHTQKTKQSIQQSVLVPVESAENRFYSNENIVMQLQYLEKQNQKLSKQVFHLSKQTSRLEQQTLRLQKQNSRLNSLCQEHKLLITEHSKTIIQLKKDLYVLQDELKEKDVYLQNNMQKLQKLDQYKYDLIELRDYTTKLQERLTQIYNQRPQTLIRLFKTVTGVRDSLNNTIIRDSTVNKHQSTIIKHQNTLIKPQILSKKVSMSDSMVKMSSITLIDQSCNLNTKKGLSESVTQIRPLTNRQHKSPENQTHKSIPQYLFMASSSQIQLTNSELRHIEGSTVRMQNELSFMQMELYQVKANVQFQQEKYQTECINHSQTKMELFALQEKIKIMDKQTKALEKSMKDMTREKDTLQKEISTLKKEIKHLSQENQKLQKQLQRVQKYEKQSRIQTFMLRQSKQEQQYQLSITIKQQKIQLQSIKQHLTKSKHHYQSLQQIINTSKQTIIEQNQQLLAVNNQLSQINKENESLKLSVLELKTKEEHIKGYLTGLEGEIAEVYRIVEEKENNQEHLNNLLIEREQVIETKENQVLKLQEAIKAIEMKLQLTQKQLALQRLKLSCLSPSQESLLSAISPFSAISPTSTISPSSLVSATWKSPPLSPSISPRQSQQQQQQQLKLTLLQTSNNELIKKNKELISVINKNASVLVSFEKQKKQLIHLKKLSQQIMEMQKENTHLKQQNTHIMKEQQKAVHLVNELTAKHSQQKTQLTQRLSHLNTQLSKQQQTNQKLFQSNIKLKEQLLTLQANLAQTLQQLSETQLKLNKIMKEKKLLEETHKILQNKLKNYQSLLLQHQQTISEKDSAIKQLSTKLKTYQTYHPHTDSLKTSSNKNMLIDQQVSEIKIESDIRIQSQIHDSNNTTNNNKFFRKSSRQNSHHQHSSINKQQSLHNDSSYIISPLSQTEEEKKKRHDAFKVQDKIIEQNQNKKSLQDNQRNNLKDNSRVNLLISMIQSYLDIKSHSTLNSDITKLIQNINKLKANSESPSQNRTEVIGSIVKKSHQIMIELQKYKTKLLKDNKTKIKSAIDTLIEPVKSLENKLHQLAALVEIFQKQIH